MQIMLPTWTFFASVVIAETFQFFWLNKKTALIIKQSITSANWLVTFSSAVTSAQSKLSCNFCLSNSKILSFTVFAITVLLVSS